MTEIYERHLAEIIKVNTLSSAPTFQLAAKTCEKITHESMIKFAEWVEDNTCGRSKVKNEKWVYQMLNTDEYKTTEELLELYLKEK